MAKKVMTCFFLPARILLALMESVTHSGFRMGGRVRLFLNPQSHEMPNVFESGPGLQAFRIGFVNRVQVLWLLPVVQVLAIWQIGADDVAHPADRIVVLKNAPMRKHKMP